MDRLIGIETEYGIARSDLEKVDPVEESVALVRARLSSPFRSEWDYTLEDPRQDARGFKADELLQDREERAFAETDRARAMTFQEMKSDLVLSNGARFYNDHTHPEYSSPECRGLFDLVAHDRAGEEILLECVRRRNEALGADVVRLYKNNTDYRGHSYGCHDNYLMARRVPFEKIISGLAPFLVTRQIFAGAGKVGLEIGTAYRRGIFQISQRADFIETLASVDTMAKRPIINTRDEPHADRDRWRRLHIILGDANLSEFATALKVGTTALVISLIEENAAPPEIALENPVEAVRQISRDPSVAWSVRMADGRTIGAIDIQRRYLAACQLRFSGRDSETAWVLENWEEVLDLLAADPRRLADRLDWVAKRALLEAFIAEEKLGWRDPWIQSLDLEYHNIDPERGLARGLEAEGRMVRLVEESRIKDAMIRGPADTRAAVRGACVEKFPGAIRSVQWERVIFSINGRERVLDLGSVIESAEARSLLERIEKARSPEELFAAPDGV